MKIIARHKWVSGATITESYDEKNDKIRRFTATIRGFQNWKIFEGEMTDGIVKKVIANVKAIRGRIDAGDGEIFYLKEGYKL